MRNFRFKACRGAAILALLAAPYIVPGAAGSTDGPDARPVFPDLLLVDGSGLPFRLARYLGQNVVVIEFGASACGPCVQDLTYLNRLQGDFRKFPVKVIAVSEDDADITAIKEFEKRQKLNFLQPFADPKATAAQALGVTALPTTYIVDRHGRIALTVQGPQVWDSAAYEARIRMLLLQP